MLLPFRCVIRFVSVELNFVSLSDYFDQHKGIRNHLSENLQVFVEASFPTKTNFRKKSKSTVLVQHLNLV